MTLDELINMIKIRPGMFLGDDIEIKSFYHFINGFICAKHPIVLPSDYESHFNQMFKDFIIKHSPYSNVSSEICTLKMWYEIIQFVSDSKNDELAVFFELYEAFKIEIGN